MNPFPLSGRLLLILSNAEDGDRFAQALAQNGNFAFIFAYDVERALTLARTLEPDLTIVAVPFDRGISICQALRNDPNVAALRVLLVIDRRYLAEARASGANAYVLQPASALLIAAEARAVLARPERRTLTVTDRRSMFRGGRRLADVHSG
jgi:DNA-binding response OmpR family regulator